MARVELQGIQKSFGATKVISHLDLEIGSGEFVALVGPSGCGKSTILRMVAGLDEPTAGIIRIDGQVVNDLSPKDRGIALVFQNYALYPHMTVRENIEFPLKMAKLDRGEVASRVTEAAEILGLGTLLDRKPAQLSGGQKQRVAMGRAMVRRPKVLLFDEPLSNLDAQLRHRVRAEIAHLHKRIGSTVIYVTHDQVEAMTLADRIAILHQGNLEQYGPPLEVYQRPKSQFVASFIGTPPMNLLPAEKVQPSVPPAAKVVGVRPDRVRLRGGAGVQIAIGRVSLVEPLGSSTHVHVQVGESMAIVETSGAEQPGLDQEVVLWALPEELFYFDSAGARLSV